MSSQQHRTRLLKELSARLTRDKQLRYTERELEMQKLLMGKGGSRKLKGVEKVGDDEDDEDEEGDAADEGAGRDDDEDDAGARRSSKRIRITEGWDVHRGQRVSIAPPLPPANEEKKQKEHAAAKRELNAVKARRRSSRGRPSMGAPPGSFALSLLLV